jgi:hypothetical protein
MMKVLFLVLLAVVAVNAQFPNDDDDQITRVLIDDFTVGGNIQKSIVSLSSDLTGPPSVINDSTFNEGGCSGLIGCGRDMRMEAITGFGGRSFESEIFLVSGGYFFGEWAVANPKTSSSVATIQYDGQDGAFGTLNLNGLGPTDITDGGLVTTLKLSIITDLPSTYNIVLYSPNGSTCTTSVSALAINGAYNYFDTFVEIPIGNFVGSCTLSSIGAIEISLPSSDAVDAIVRTIQFTGPPDPSPSATPTPTPTRTIAPTQSNTPTRTPTPTPSSSTECSLICNCPAFSCHLIYAFDDDDDFFYF